MRRIILCVLPLLFLLVSFQSSLTITGKITDEKGNPIPNVSVTAKQKNAVLSDAQGEYSITVSDAKGTLEFSAVGYRTQTVAIKNRTVIHVTLHSNNASLQEVVITANGINQQRKKAEAVSIQLRGMNSISAHQLYGSVAGVQINTNGYPAKDFNTEEYEHITENGFQKVTDQPLSTFSIDVDAASYSNVRRFLNDGQLPPAGAVRIEEMVNYFHYSYPQPAEHHPFSINTEIANCPWNKDHRLVLIGLQGKKVPVENLPPSNLVFLIDVSGSMEMPNKLPLVQQSLKLLVDQLREQDKVAIVVYAGNAGLVLPSTNGLQKQTIKDAISRLRAGGSTAGGEGIKLAYEIAKENFVKSGNNRVILCTDGDFNVGASSDDELENLIEKERSSGVFLTVLGYGMGNYKDSKMQKLADKGNGNHSYIDSENEAKKVLVHEFGGTLFTIAKDVKLQVEFNPAKVQGYRLIGYENRVLHNEDFNDDQKDAGELGSGHTVTALYEIIPAGEKSAFLKQVDSLKYQHKNQVSAINNGELLTVKFRYKAPDGNVSKLIEHPVMDATIELEKVSENLRFAASVAEFGMLLRQSNFKQNASYTNVLRNATKAIGTDAEGYRKEFIMLVKKAAALQTLQNLDEEENSITDK